MSAGITTGLCGGPVDFSLCMFYTNVSLCKALANGIEFILYNFIRKEYFMSKKSITLTSKDIINIRKDLDANIMNNWRIIRSENVMSKKAKSAGMGTGKDLNALYNLITQMQEKRIKIKAALCYLNMGLEFNYEEFKKTNNYCIFAACEAKEAIAQLKMVPTLDPATKAKKGLKNMAKSETFTSAKIASLIKDLQLKANKYDSMMEDFNSKTTIDLGDISEEFEKDIAG